MTRSPRSTGPSRSTCKSVPAGTRRRVRSRLRHLGVRRRIVISERPATGWEALTSAEAAVAYLAAEGKTNREIAETLFISPHTVNSHLRHIFDKLGINSRISLTRMAEPPRARRTERTVTRAH